MNTLKNRVQLIGNLGNDPEVINTDSGKKLAKFSLATNENYKNAQGERTTETQWHHIIAWNKTAEIVEKFASQGKKVAVTGKLTNRSYEDAQGQKRNITEVVAQEILFLKNK